MKIWIWAFLGLSFPAFAQSPTVVYGASETAPDTPDSYLLIQPKDSPNPLGNPIPDEMNDVQSDSQNLPMATQSQQSDKAAPINEINQSEAQNPPPFSQSPEQEQNQIENTLYEGGNRIYDVQSYPINDVKTITEPNIDPTITTYPEY